LLPVYALIPSPTGWSDSMERVVQFLDEVDEVVMLAGEAWATPRRALLLVTGLLLTLALLIWVL